MKKIGFAAALAVGAVLSSCGQKSFGENTVRNGDFSGGLSPWEISGDSAGTSVSEQNGLAFSGSFGASVPVVLQNGKKYELSFSAGAESGSVMKVTLSDAGMPAKPLFTASDSLNSEKKRYSYTVVLDKKTERHSLCRLAFTTDSPVKGGVLDSVSLREINPQESRVAKSQVTEIIQGDTAVISWKPHPYVNQIRIEYLKPDAPSQWREITPHTPAQSESYKWEVPQDLGSSPIFVRVSSASSPEECEIIQAVPVK